MTPSTAAAHYSLNKFSSHQLVDLANTWLEESIFTDSINYLAMAKDPVMAEVAPLFESSISELGLSIPSRIDAAIYLAIETAENMLSGNTDLVEGASYLYWNIHHEITDVLPDKEHIGTNLGLEYVFCWLREIWDCRDGSHINYYQDLPREQAKEKFIEHLREESEKWLTHIKSQKGSIQ
ncbi:hypothetical protein M9194_20835 [Vibrio sp. S4M6]|uniref:hypothetical protein n=1 Tax=Vibrio sinus TaxID=2946865 RepID=UPI002029B7E0|nr:hypothetical protein [Vibrio sinus]MCL9783872.1 hypothetical protein [Vibrio sinus]